MNLSIAQNAMNLLLTRMAISLATNTLLHGVNRNHTYSSTVQNTDCILKVKNTKSRLTEFSYQEL